MRIQKSDIIESLYTSGRGIGQVMFQNNAWSGFLMLLGIALNSWTAALLALAGNVTGTLTACILKYPSKDIRDGLYGFNGTLVGIAVGTFMKTNVWSLLLLVIGAALSTLIAKLFSKQTLLPGYTAPFIISVWILLAACRWLFPSLLLSPADSPAAQSPDLLDAFFLNIGQVMFQGGTVISGLFFLLAMSNTKDFLGTVFGAALPMLLLLIPSVDITAFNAGLLGYNAVLCAIATGDKSMKGVLAATFSVLLSIALQMAGMHVGITTLTAPFVLSVWITRLLGSIKTSRTA